MPVSPGTHLGPYEILSPLGAGGMGEVYRARDTRLDRTVAIKILPSHFSGDAARKQRFEREARTVSSLNHPHICTLHDIGHDSGVDFLVMEFVEGETLAKRLSKGALPFDQILHYGTEISDALSKAHRQGVVHRDLKPANIMLTKSGVKLLDFGLARLLPAAVAPMSPSAISAAGTPPLQEMATASKPLTAEGTLVGTLQYMAPEQLEGKDADARTDIFALGAVLYEMATGKKAFEGKSQASVIAAILEKDPTPITTLQPLAPAALERVVKACLAKDPDDRWQTAHDILLELKWIAEGGSQAAGPAPAGSRWKLPIWFTGAGWVLAVAALALAGWLHFASNRLEPLVSRSVILPPEKTTFNVSFPGGGHLAVSPNGHRLAFVAVGSDGARKLWVRPVSSLQAAALPGTEEAFYPFWSADSRSVAFFARGKLKRIDVEGGNPQNICDAPEGRSGAWNQNGVIVFAPAPTGPLSRVTQGGGTPEKVTTLDESRQETTHRWPWFLPDGDHFLYFARSRSAGKSVVFVQSLRTGKRELVLATGTSAVYSSGYLLFMRESALVAQPFDAGRLALSGEPSVVADSVQSDLGFGKGHFSVSDNGILVYLPGNAVGDSQLVWFDRTGRQIGSASETGNFTSPAISPDSRLLAFSAVDTSGKADIWVQDLLRGTRTRLTFDPLYAVDPIWSPDGRQIMFASFRAGQYDLYVKPADGSRDEQVLLSVAGGKYPSSWSKDGKFIAYEFYGVPGMVGEDIWVLPLGGAKQPFPFVQSQFEKLQPRFSPDGRWIAYQSDETGRFEIYVAPFPGPGGRRQLSVSGGIRPRWRGDGRELFFLGSDNRLMAVDIRTSGARLEPGAPQALFQTRAKVARSVYDVAPDGSKFVIATTLPEQNATPVTLVTNWSAELKK